MRKNEVKDYKSFVNIEEIFDWSLEEKETSLSNFKKKKFNKKYINFFNKKKRVVNYNYCKKFTNKIFQELYKKLNKYHKTNFSNKYWKTIIYSWLFLLVNITYEYWLLSNSLKNKKKKYYIFKVDEK